MAAVCGLTLIKSFPYRDNPNEEWSNTYWLTGVIPASSAAWKTLADGMIAAEQPVYVSDVEVVRAYGYATDNPDDASVWGYDYVLGTGTPNGTLVTTTDVPQGGDSAVWVRWTTSRRNSAGKVIYLRKYFHPAVADGSDVSTRDNVAPAQRAALLAFGLQCYNATLPEGRQIRSQLHAEDITGHAASLYVTTRTLKRRGKRPSS